MLDEDLVTNSCDHQCETVVKVVVIEINRWLTGALAAASAALMVSLYWTIGKVGAASVPLAITKVLSDLVVPWVQPLAVVVA